MSESIIDHTFGINRQARAVMDYLDIKPYWADKNDGFYDIFLETKPWYNGREKGFVLSMTKWKTKKKERYIHIAVYEHRNIDSICALRWTTENGYWNHPLEDKEIFEKAYSGESKYDYAFSVQYGECGKMAKWVMEELEKFYRELGKNKEEEGEGKE